MQPEIINPGELPRPRGYSYGVLAAGRLLFTAGQDPRGPDGRVVAPGDLVAQFRQVLLNLQSVVRAAGGEMGDIVRLEIFVKDLDGYRSALKPIGEIFRSFFGNYYPAITLVEVSGLFEPEALVEIQGVAVIPDGPGEVKRCG